MRVVQVAKPNAPFELVERPIPEPGPCEARIKVEACGICYSDTYVVTGTYPGVHFPAVPGHEVAGRIDAVGSEVTNWRAGQRVGVGWFGGVAGRVPAAGGAISSPAATSGFPAFTSTAAMPTT